MTYECTILFFLLWEYCFHVRATFSLAYTYVASDTAVAMLAISCVKPSLHYVSVIQAVSSFPTKIFMYFPPTQCVLHVIHSQCEAGPGKGFIHLNTGKRL